MLDFELKVTEIPPSFQVGVLTSGAFLMTYPTVNLDSDCFFFVTKFLVVLFFFHTFWGYQYIGKYSHNQCIIKQFSLKSTLIRSENSCSCTSVSVKISINIKMKYRNIDYVNKIWTFDLWVTVLLMKVTNTVRSWWKLRLLRSAGARHLCATEYESDQRVTEWFAAAAANRGS